MMIAVATLGIESAAFGERFEEGGLPATVFAYKERDVGPKGDVDSSREGGNVEWISARSDSFRDSDNATQERRAHGSALLCGRRGFRLHAGIILESSLMPNTGLSC